LFGVRWLDRIIEKHEGPEDWAGVLQFYEPEFLRLGGFDVLLPLVKDRLPNITVLRTIVSSDAKTLIFFLKDTSYVSSPEFEMFDAGRLAICEKMPEADFYIAIVYHEWFIIENEGLP
jgi:hypothetical protein